MNSEFLGHAGVLCDNASVTTAMFSDKIKRLCFSYFPSVFMKHPLCSYCAVQTVTPMVWFLQQLYFSNFRLMILSTGIVHQSTVYTALTTGMRCITTFQSTTDHLYEGGPIIVKYKNIILTIVLQLPTVFSTVTRCTGL